jgi:hypothetical protein
MQLYEVQSGEISGYFKADSSEAALAKAISRVQKVKGRKPPMPGLLARVRTVDEKYNPTGTTKENPEGWFYLNPLQTIRKYA